MLAKFKIIMDRPWEKTAFYLLFVLAVTLFLMQMLSLYTTPIPDSYLWWGDESWLMIEFRTQILEGIFRHPYALASSIEHGSGLLFGNMWVPALFYGIPAAVLRNHAVDIITIGRSVTALLAVTLLLSTYEIIYKLTSERIIALFGVILLLSSRSFLFTSHSARYDILTALAILIGIYLSLQLIARDELKWRQAALIGFGTAATVLITVHVTITIGLAVFASVLLCSSGNRTQNAIAFIGSSLLFILLLIGLSELRGQLSLFGGSAQNSYYLNLHDIPAFRPFSRSVQVANLVQRWKIFSALGLGYLITLLALVAPALYGLWTKRFSFHITSHVTILLIAIASWLLFESSAPTSYLIYILPPLSVAIALSVHTLLPHPAGRWLIIPTGVILCLFGFADAPFSHSVGASVSKQNEKAIDAALAMVEQENPNSRPLVLAFNPAVHRVLRDTNVRLMTTHFVEFPQASELEVRSTQDIILKENVQYILLYRSAIKPDYMREAQPIAAVAHSMGTLVFEDTGYFTDIGRSYFSTTMGLPDTIQVYRLSEP